MQNSEGVIQQRLLAGTAGAGCVFRLVATLQHCSTAAPLLTLQTLFIQIFFWCARQLAAVLFTRLFTGRALFREW